MKMNKLTFSFEFLVNEAKSLLTRLNLVKPFALTMPMVTAANVNDEAMKGITNLLLAGNKELRKEVNQFIQFLRDPLNSNIAPEEAQTRFSLLKLRFNALLDQFDIFADVLSQRSEHETGVWISGLDVLANDALKLNGNFFDAPPIMCYVERGHGAAIRRARTRLPGGDLNPVSVIQVPRERMVSSGIASSLIHEVGHQGAALLNLIESLRSDILKAQKFSNYKNAWNLYYRWISEIISDFWAMGFLGIGATIGLMNVVSLPRYFMFRIKLDDPHPFPWIRVKLSLAFGKALYPHEQWNNYEQLWQKLYPTDKLEAKNLLIVKELIACMPEFVRTIVNHKSAKFGNVNLPEIFPFRKRQPNFLRDLFKEWQKYPEKMNTAGPTLLFAVIGQAHSDGGVSSDSESKILSRYLTQWAFLRSEKRSLTANKKTISEIQELIN